MRGTCPGVTFVGWWWLAEVTQHPCFMACVYTDTYKHTHTCTHKNIRTHTRTCTDHSSGPPATLFAHVNVVFIFFFSPTTTFYCLHTFMLQALTCRQIPPFLTLHYLSTTFILFFSCPLSPTISQQPSSSSISRLSSLAISQQLSSSSAHRPPSPSNINLQLLFLSAPPPSVTHHDLQL